MDTNKMFIVADKKEVNSEERSVIAWGSRPIIDRDGEVISGGKKTWNLDNFRKNPVLLISHDYKRPPVGKVLWVKATDEGLQFKAQFAKTQAGEELWELYKSEIMNAFSVGFIPKEWDIPKEYELEGKKNSPSRIYKSVELLEISCVSVPSCPAAVVEEILGKGMLTNKDVTDIFEEIKQKTPTKEVNLDVQKETPKKETETADTTVATQTEEKEIKAAGMCECPECGKKMEKKEDQACSMMKCPDCEKPMRDMKSEKSFCDCKSSEYEEDVCKACGGKRKPKKGANLDLARTEPLPDNYTGNDFPIPAETEEKTEDGFMSVIESLTDKVTEKGLKKIIESRNISPLRFKFSTPETKPDTTYESWNDSVFKSFDIASVPSRPTTREFALLCSFLGCQVKEVYQNSFDVPSPLLGTYLAGFKAALKDYDLKDTRRIGWDEEYPPVYEVIKLNSKTEDDFLVSGIEYYEADDKPLVVKYNPTWWGMNIVLYSNSKDRAFNKSVLKAAQDWIDENNPLKGEKFALNGEFITVDKGGDTFESVILSEDVEEPVQRAARLINEKGTGLGSRGLLFIGPPGTGKTKSGRILMSQTDCTFIWVSSKDFSKVGAVRGLELAFSLTRSLAPSILFLEDIDSWLYGSGVNDLLKTELDGLGKGKGVVTILTSNFPEKLPDALLDRPGRFHDVLKFDLPDSKIREKMVKTWAGDIEEPMLAQIVSGTEGFSGAHMRELVDFAYLLMEEEDITIAEALRKSLEKLSSQRQLIREIRKEKNLEVPIISDKETSEGFSWDAVKGFYNDDSGKAPDAMETKTASEEIYDIDFDSLTSSLSNVVERIKEDKTSYLGLSEEQIERMVNDAFEEELKKRKGVMY